MSLCFAEAVDTSYKILRCTGPSKSNPKGKCSVLEGRFPQKRFESARPTES